MLILIHGADTYRSLQKLRALKKEFQKKFDSQGLGLVNFDEENFELAKFLQEARASSLLSPKKLIALKNIELQNLKELKPDELPEENIIIFYFPFTLTQKNNFCKSLLKEKNVYHFQPFNNFELNKWIKQKISAEKAQIEPQALNLLCVCIGSNLWQMEREIEKLLAFSERHIKIKDVQKMVPSKIDDKIFDLVDSIALKNKKRAVELFEDQLKLGRDVFYLLAMIIRQFRLLLMVKSRLSQGRATPAQISQELKLHPYVSQKLSQQVQGFSGQGLRKIYEKLLEIDFKLKTSKLDAKVLLERMIVE